MSLEEPEKFSHTSSQLLAALSIDAGARYKFMSPGKFQVEVSHKYNAVVEITLVKKFFQLL